VTLIVPGESLGPAKLGMTRRNLVATLGPSAPGPAGTLAFPRWGVLVALRDGAAVRLSTTSPRFRTLFGAGVGSRSDEVPRLIGDMNSASMESGSDVTVLYPFQGVGFVSRGGRVVAAFVVERIAMGPQIAPGPAVSAPPGLMPVPPGMPPASSGTAPSQAPQSPGGPVPAASFALRGLAETVDVGGPLLRISGRIANTGRGAAGPVVMNVVFHRVSGDESTKQVTIAQALAPGAEAPFTITTFVATDLVTRYVIQIPDGTAAPFSQTRTVPVAAYTELAKQRIKIDVQLGAPSASDLRGPGVQALISIKDTTPIPIAWVRGVLVLIPPSPNTPNRQGQQVRLTPGQTVTIIVPAAAGFGGGVTPQGTFPPLVGQPQVLDVTLGAQ